MTTKFIASKSKTLTAILYWEEDVYIAECPEVGTAIQGETVEEALANFKEATELYLEEFPLLNTSPRLITIFEVTKRDRYLMGSTDLP